MYKNLTALNGGLIALMLFVNSLLAAEIGPFLSSLVFYLVGFFILLGLWRSSERRGFHPWKMPLFYFAPGVLGVMTTIINNIGVQKMGVMLISGLALFGQLVMSAVIEHYGLFGMPKRCFKPQKAVGFALILLGILVMLAL